MANKQRGPLPPVMSSEETRVKPPEEEEAELPPDEPSWDPAQDRTQLLPSAPAVQAAYTGDDATPPVPRKVDPIPFPTEEDLLGTDDATPTPIRLPSPPPPAQHAPDDDSTRNMPRKSMVKPGPPVDENATRNIRMTGNRPALQDEDATRAPLRKSTVRPALQDENATRPPVRGAGPAPTLPPEPTTEPPLPWDAQEAPESAIPTRTQNLPPIVSGPAQGMVYPPEGPPVLVPVNTEPHYIRQAPMVHAITQPNYVPPPPSMLQPVVTSPHLTQPPQPAFLSTPPPAEDLRTTFSNKAALVADLVKGTFARRSYGPYRLRIDEPDGPSTAGGLHARQPISLVSHAETAPNVLVGWVDVAKKEAQLRSYASVVRRHKSRYGVGPDILEEEYERFFNELVETLFYGGIKIVVLVPDDQDPPQTQAQAQAQAQAPQQRAGRSCLGTLFLISLTFAVGVGVGVNAERFEPLIEQVKALLPGR